MEESSPKIEGKDKEFATFGEFETIEKSRKVKGKPEFEIVEKSIYYDGRQYSCKLPPEMMKAIGYKDGDKLKFILIKKPLEGKAELRIEYARK